MKLTTINNISNKEIITTLWNQEFGKIHPISDELFKRNIKNIYEKASFVALENDEIVGFILTKIWDKNFQINAYIDVAWISLIYVMPKYRRQGIGARLLNDATKALQEIGKKILYIGRDIYNYFPGLPIDMNKNIDFFIKNGFEYSYQTHDLISRNDELLPIKNKIGYTFRLGTIEDKNELISFMNKNWPGRWTYETIDYFDNGGNGNEYLICLNSKNEICAFTKICYPDTDINLISNSVTWRARFKKLGGIGPLGVDPAYRGNHLGYDIVAWSVNKLIKQNVTEIIIDWTGLLEFYRQFGFEVWKSYSYLTKKIS